MKKGDIFVGKVLHTDFPNKGILEIDAQRVAVKNALEGQTIRFSISKKKRGNITVIPETPCITAGCKRNIP